MAEYIIKRNSKLFQFHYGSIKGKTRQYKAELSLKFQFHYGSIKGQSGRAITPLEACFNSTMVRLKETKTTCSTSSMTSFNSTMVRLKDTPYYVTTLKVWFQFHYGSIKGMTSGREWIRAKTFQFHYGSIKGALPDGVCFTVTVSIPLWFD